MTVIKPTVIFDLDGTLIDSLPDTTIAVNFVLASLNFPLLTEKEACSMISNGLLVLIRKAFSAHSFEILDEAKLVQCAMLYRYFYTTYPITHTTVYPGVLRTLSILKRRGYQLGICTNKPDSIAHIILDILGLGQYFTSIVCGESTPFRKPDARPLNAAMLQIGVATCIYVGDSVVDINTACNAGTHLIFVKYGYVQNLKQDLKQERILVIDSFCELLRVDI